MAQHVCAGILRRIRVSHPGLESSTSPRMSLRLGNSTTGQLGFDNQRSVFTKLGISSG
jgi:hypothetical protein